MSTRKTLRLVVIVSAGIDPANTENDTWIDIHVYKTMTLNTVHKIIVKLLALPEGSLENLTYYRDDEKNSMVEREYTFHELNVNNDDKLILDFKRKRGQKRKIKNVEDGSHEDVDRPENNIGGTTLELVCTTRIFEAEGAPLRRVRVLVNSSHQCHTFMEDIANYWRRSGLKFKCGRTVLYGEKTWDDLGVENGSEIVVTGGRL